MKELSLDDRPREKLLRARRGGARRQRARRAGHRRRIAARPARLSVANDLLAAHGGLHGLTRCTPDDLSRVAGIGQARAAQIIAALELGRRTLTHAPIERRAAASRP